MSNNQIISIVTKSVEEVSVKALKQLLSGEFGVTRLSSKQLKKAHLVRIAEHYDVTGVKVVREKNNEGTELLKVKAVFENVPVNKEGKKVKTTKQALAVLAHKEGQSVVTDVISVMASGVKLSEICKSPEDYVQLSHVASMNRFKKDFNPYYVTIPTRESALVFEAALTDASLEKVDGTMRAVVEPKLALRSQNHVIDTLAKKYAFICNNPTTGEIEVMDADTIRKIKHLGATLEDGSIMHDNVKYKRVRDMRYIVSVDYNLTPEGEDGKMTRDQSFLQTKAVLDGLYFLLNGKYVRYEYFMASASERRTVMGTHIAHLDAIDALHSLGMDFRQFAKYKNGVYTLDMIKSPTRFGLASTSSVSSSLIKIGSTIEEYANGEYALVGGTHSMMVASDIFAYVKEGKYLAFDAENDKFIELDAAEVPFKRNVTDGLVFADYTIQAAIAAEFGKTISAEQVRITPATKGLVVFVPGLKDMVGHDLLAFESATKGDYRTLLRNNPELEVEFRIAIFGKNAKDDKKKTNIPYQMLQTMNLDLNSVLAQLDKEIDSAFEVYDNPERLADYLGTKSIELFQDVAEDELTDEQREQLDNTLTSMFTNFFYAGDFVMKDPYFKKRLLDIIENIIRAWTQGAMPVDGHYRFMVTDVYGVMESYKMAKYAREFGYASEFLDADGDMIVPSHVGIPADRVVMVDDEDKYFVEGKEIIFQRNPKISMKETAKATGYVNRAYYEARKKYGFAFNNLVFFSCHDFNVVKQGGADFDGDKCHASMSPILLDGFKEMPALLDLTFKDGEYVEGCPWQPKTEASFDFFGSAYRSDVVVDGKQFNDEFKVMFTDADYNMDFARQCHELSKVFVLRSLEPNKIGSLTNFASQLLAGISRLQYGLSNNVNVETYALLSVEEREEYEREVEMMEFQVDKLRLAQGWEIDRPKHGGAFWKYFNLAFIADPEYGNEALYPKYVSELKRTKTGTVRVYSKMEWMKAVKTRKSLEIQDGQQYFSFMQLVRAHVIFKFNNEIVNRFEEMNPTEDANNLIYDFAPHANVYDLGVVEAIQKMLVPVFAEYGRGQMEIMQQEQQTAAQRDTVIKNMPRSQVEKYDRANKIKFQQKRSHVINTARSQIKALPFDEATVAYVAYAKKYREYRPSKAAGAASGLSFPWIVCQDGMLELVSRVSGKSIQHVKTELVVPAPVTFRFRTNPALSVEQVNAVFASADRGAVFYHVDENTGNYLPFVYVNKVCVGHLFDDSTYYFTGSERFVFYPQAVKVTSKSASVTVRPEVGIVRH